MTCSMIAGRNGVMFHGRRADEADFSVRVGFGIFLAFSRYIALQGPYISSWVTTRNAFLIEALSKRCSVPWGIRGVERLMAIWCMRFETIPSRFPPSVSATSWPFSSRCSTVTTSLIRWPIFAAYFSTSMRIRVRRARL